MNDTDITSEGGTGQPTTGDGGLRVPLGVHIAALRAADRLFDIERDRRYTELAEEREKAVAIKERGDKIALELAASIQTYKDQQTTELRSRVEMASGAYATKDDLVQAVGKIEGSLRPLVEFMTQTQGRREGVSTSFGTVIASFGGIAAVATTVIVITTLLTGQ